MNIIRKRLPALLLALLMPEQNEKYSFAGQLQKLDWFSVRLFVTDGEGFDPLVPGVSCQSSDE